VDQFPKLKKQTLVDDFIRRFEEMILSGKLSIGEKLPSERDLAINLGVSRPVVHEGLIDLATKGLITRTPTGSAIINDYRKDGSLSILNSLLSFQDGRLEPKITASTIEFRLLVEVENARLAARNRTAEQLAAMQAILAEEQSADVTKPEAIAQLDFRFHHLIAMATDNIFYPLLLNSFKTLYLNFVIQFFSNPAFAPQVFAFHTQLVHAIADRDEKAAVDVMNRMLDHGKKHFIKMVSVKQ
jgi:DNA-binding FadR family transcriptional regulator